MTKADIKADILRDVKITKQRYIADICNDGVFVMFPSGDVQRFESRSTATTAIKRHAKRNNKGIHVAVIEWNYRDRKVQETVE